MATFMPRQDGSMRRSIRTILTLALITYSIFLTYIVFGSQHTLIILPTQQHQEPLPSQPIIKTTDIQMIDSRKQEPDKTVRQQVDPPPPPASPATLLVLEETATAQKTETSAVAVNAVSDQKKTKKPYTEQYHIVMSTGSGIYAEWQSRASYYWYKRVKEQDKHGAMGGFTRLLHSGQPDSLMDEMPTIVVDPLPPKLQAIAAGYVVLDRPWAFQQFVKQHLDDIKESYILMTEPDHIFLQAPPLWGTPTRPAAFPFSYMNPGQEDYKEIIARHNPKKAPVNTIFPIGNSPVMIHRDQMAHVIPKWVNISLELKQDREADVAWGWIIEMYAYSIASSQTEGGPIMYELHSEFQLQPPFDTKLSVMNVPAYIIHYTYGQDFNENGEYTPGQVGYWHWDKRDFTNTYPPASNITMPPEGCSNEAVKEMMRRLKEAASHLPGWPQ